MEEKSFLGIFIKFGQQEHIEAMQKSGLLFCNTVVSFVSTPDGKLRGDELENVTYQQYIGNAVVAMKEPDEPDTAFKDVATAESVRIFSRTVQSGNLFCLYHHGFDEESELQEHEVCARCAEFGSHALVIYNVKEFLGRLQSSLKAKNINYSLAAVQYTDLRTYSGHKHIYQKDISYSWQKEFRIHIQHDEDLPILLEIGSLEDISHIHVIGEKPAFKLKMVRTEI